jgi:N-acetylglucosaminyldiphosphoundecaprenol N-acetyl-beta-D-mannosaminyltransferase
MAEPRELSADNLPTVDLHGLVVHAVTESEAVAYIVSQARAGIGGWVVTHNLDHLRRACRDPEVLDLYASADLRVGDGMALVWASWLQGTPLPERVAGSNMIHSLTEAASNSGLRVFFLGGDPGTAESAASRLRDRYPQLLVAGTACPQVGFESRPADVEALMQQLTAARPDLVYVALGSPKQEQVIDRVRAAQPLAWWLGVGISFSFVAGTVRRAPRWMQWCGLEWLHRLAQEPGRLFRRYVIEGLPFAARLFTSCAVRRIRRRPIKTCRQTTD